MLTRLKLAMGVPFSWSPRSQLGSLPVPSGTALKLFYGNKAAGKENRSDLATPDH